MVSQSRGAEEDSGGYYVWSRVEGVMAYSKISIKLKGKVLMSSVMPANIYGLKMVALTVTTEVADL